MFGLTRISIAALLAGLRLVSAATALGGPTSDIHLVIHDTRSDMYHVYRRDGSVWGRLNHEEFKRDVEYEMMSAREPSACHAMTMDHAKALPGWKKIEEYAENKYGGGKKSISVNPSGYTEYPARVCVDNTEVTQVEIKGDPACIENDAKVEGQMIGTSGTVKLSYQQGFSNSATWSIIKTSSIATSLEFSAELTIPSFGKVGGSTSTTATFTNSMGSSFSTSVTNLLTQEMTMNAGEGQHCIGTLKTQTCNVNGQGKIRLVASGFIWFNYDDKRAPKDDPKGDKHYKYAINIVSALENIDDRSSFLDFVGSMKATVQSDYQAKCE